MGLESAGLSRTCSYHATAACKFFTGTLASALSIDMGFLSFPEKLPVNFHYVSCEIAIISATKLTSAHAARATWEYSQRLRNFVQSSGKFLSRRVRSVPNAKKPAPARFNFTSSTQN